MAYTMTQTTIKPADKKWFRDVDPAAARRQADLLRNGAGITSFNRNLTDVNTWVTTVGFTDEATCTALLASIEANADAQAREAYNAANGIVQTRTFA